jgi:hypothetical protein
MLGNLVDDVSFLNALRLSFRRNPQQAVFLARETYDGAPSREEFVAAFER